MGNLQVGDLSDCPLFGLNSPFRALAPLAHLMPLRMWA